MSKINLDNLQKDIDILLENETEESMKQWVEDYNSKLPKVYVIGEEKREEAEAWLRANNYVPCNHILKCVSAVILEDYFSPTPKPVPPEITIPVYRYIFLKDGGIY